MNILKLGSTGEDVKLLQQKLKELNYYNLVITGDFLLSTEVGVKAFQENSNLKPTGIVDSETWEKLNLYTQPAISTISILPTLKKGDSGQYVSELQSKLSSLLYYTGKINGTFDLDVESAVKRFQLNNDLTADGIVGNNTWRVINTLYGNLNECAKESNDNIDNNDNYIEYKVVKGDTLYAISNRYNVSVDSIKNLNGLTSNILSIGQVLKIPTSNINDYIEYKVVKGDTLYAISNRYNVSVDSIKNLNGLTSNILSIGQVLKIPTSNINDYIEYKVVKGDTLYAISNRYNVSVDSIKKLNGLTSNILSIGQVLKIPTNNN